MDSYNIKKFVRNIFDFFKLRFIYYHPVKENTIVKESGQFDCLRDKGANKYG